VSLWDLATKSPPITFNPFTNKLGSLALSPDGRFLATGEHQEYGNSVALWDISARSGRPRLLWSRQLDVGFNILRFSHDGQTVVANAKSFADGTIGTWDTLSGKELLAFPKGSIGYVNDLTFSPDGTLLAAVGVQSTINVWDFKNRTVKFQFPG